MMMTSMMMSMTMTHSDSTAIPNQLISSPSNKRSHNKHSVSKHFFNPWPYQTQLPHAATPLMIPMATWMPHLHPMTPQQQHTWLLLISNLLHFASTSATYTLKRALSLPTSCIKLPHLASTHNCLNDNSCWQWTLCPNKKLTAKTPTDPSPSTHPSQPF